MGTSYVLVPAQTLQDRSAEVSYPPRPRAQNGPGIFMRRFLFSMFEESKLSHPADDIRSHQIFEKKEARYPVLLDRRWHAVSHNPNNNGA